MRRKFQYSLIVLGSFAISTLCFANTVPSSSYLYPGIKGYISDVEICENGLLAIEMSFTPEQVCTYNGGINICNSFNPTWYYVDPSDEGDSQLTHLVATATAAEINQFKVSYFTSSTSAPHKSFSCNGITVNADFELTVLGTTNQN